MSCQLVNTLVWAVLQGSLTCFLPVFVIVLRIDIVWYTEQEKVGQLQTANHHSLLWTSYISYIFMSQWIMRRNIPSEWGDVDSLAALHCTDAAWCSLLGLMHRHCQLPAQGTGRNPRLCELSCWLRGRKSLEQLEHGSVRGGDWSRNATTLAFMAVLPKWYWYQTSLISTKDWEQGLLCSLESSSTRIGQETEATGAQVVENGDFLGWHKLSTESPWIYWDFLVAQ